MQAEVLASTISNSLQLFENTDWKVRVVIRDGEPWFVAKDVASCIEYDQTSINKMCGLCRDKDKIVESASDFDSDELSESGNSRITLISNSLQLFQNAGFKVRVIMRCSDPWFVAKDVADSIEHSNVTKMCELCRDKDKVTITDSKEIGVINESLRTQQTFSKNTPHITLISESGLYRIIAKCNLPKCKTCV